MNGHIRRESFERIARAPHLVLVELLEIVDAHVLELDLLGAVDVGSVGENADGHARAGNMGKPVQRSAQRPTRCQAVDALDGAAETLVALRVVVLDIELSTAQPSDSTEPAHLESDLELDGLDELSLLLLGLVQQLAELASHAARRNFRHPDW